MRNIGMRIWVKIGSIIMLISMGLSINIAIAGCTSSEMFVPVPTQDFNIPSYGLSTSKPIGDWIYLSNTIITNCSDQLYGVQEYGYNSLSGQTYSEGGVTYNVYTTGVTGVGFIAAMSDSFSNIFYPVPPPGAPISATPNTGVPYGASLSITVKFKFITTALLTPDSYTIPSQTFSGVFGLGSTNNILGQGFIITNPFTVNVTANTCSVDVNSQFQSVILDNVTDNDLPEVGSTAKDKVFNVILNCQPEVYIYAKMSGTQSPDTAADGVLQVSNAGAPGTSRGIGIQILNNSTPMPIGTNMPVRMTNGGQESIPFTARYYRTLTDVVAGSANATATLDINYQ